MNSLVKLYNIIKNNFQFLIYSILIIMLLLYIFSGNNVKVKNTIEIDFLKDYCSNNLKEYLIDGIKQLEFIREFGTISIKDQKTNENIYLLTTFYKKNIITNFIVEQFISTRTQNYWLNFYESFSHIDFRHLTLDNELLLFKSFCDDFKDFVNVEIILFYENIAQQKSILDYKQEAINFLLEYVNKLNMPPYRKQQLLHFNYITQIVEQINWDLYSKTVDFNSDNKAYLKQCYHCFMSNTSLNNSLLINAFVNNFCEITKVTLVLVSFSTISVFLIFPIYNYLFYILYNKILFYLINQGIIFDMTPQELEKFCTLITIEMLKRYEYFDIVNFVLFG